jgi:predicted ATPase
MLALARFHSYMRNFDGAIAATEEGFAIANEQRSPYHVSRANVLRAVNLIEANRFEAGIKLMEQALTAHRGTGANYQSSYNLSYLALAHAKDGNLKHALELADQAIDEVERTGERWWQAEALRIKGEVLLAGAPARCAEAEDCFQTALTCAQRQGARFWQLRAAQSMARLWFKEQRPAEAQRALEAVYETLTDGFELPDLIEARALLAEIEKTTAPSVSASS